METSTLGSTGATVSRLGFGGAPAGLTNYLSDYDASNREHRLGVARAIERALEKGVTYFDTAASYGSGTSEEILGDALAGAPVFSGTGGSFASAFSAGACWTIGCASGSGGNGGGNGGGSGG